jgi:hypothetical protein
LAGFAVTPTGRFCSDPRGVDESTVSSNLDFRKLGDLLEQSATEGYENGEGGHGTITFNVETQEVLIEHNWYETVSNPDEPREI